MRKQRKRNWKKYSLLAAALTAALASPCSAYAAENAATTMQLVKTQGTVDVSSNSGKSVSLVDNMRLYNGYQIDTSEKSYAWIELDSKKLAKLDAASVADIRKRGKKLEILLDSGNVFFNITEPLKEDESLNIRTSTMVAGIRGTSGWVEVTDERNVRVSVLEGNVEVSVTDPVSGQSKKETVVSGETAVCAVYEPGTEGDKCSILRESYTQETVSGFVLEEVAADASLAEKIVEKGGLDLREVTVEEAQARVSEDEQKTRQKMEEVTVAMERQETNVSAKPVGLASQEEAPKEIAQAPAPQTPAPVPEPPAAPAPAPAPPAESDNSGQDSGSGAPQAPPPAPVLREETLTATATAEEVQSKLQAGDVKGVVINGNGETLTLAANQSLTIPSGKTLTLNNINLKIPNSSAVTVESGSAISSTKGIDVNGTLQNNGQIHGTVKLEDTQGSIATLANSGTIDGGGGCALILKGVWHAVTLSDGSKLTNASDSNATLDLNGNESVTFAGCTIENNGSGPALKWKTGDTFFESVNRLSDNTIIRSKSTAVSTKDQTPTAPFGWELPTESDAKDNEGFYRLKKAQSAPSDGG